MKKSTFLLVLLVWSSFILAQHSPIQYSRVKIILHETSIKEVAKLGLEADHGEYAAGRHLINDFSEYEIQLLEKNNIPFEILIKDVQKYYRNLNAHAHACPHEHPHQAAKDPAPCDFVPDISFDYETPENYTYGTMGGYYTYSEMLAILDDMRAKFPNLISEKAPIGDILTHEGRPIHWLRISDNPDMDEAEPEVLYTSLHHAREPNSLSQNIMFMWYLLENYDNDSEVKYLLDNTELYFIPCVNPDGYVFNETNDPEGGGLWRKNMWADSTGTVYGVDLNRNYGFEWGFDDIGSSTDVESQVYRGREPFSEPETQAVRDFCNAHQFQICLNYHTYGNLLIYPWGYLDQPTNESETFFSFAEAMTRENDYFAGTGSETVGYTVNGTSDDWMYGESKTKPAIFAMTPEVGTTYGFWPPQNAIDNFNKANVHQNLVTAHLVHNYGELEDESSDVLLAQTGTIDFNFKKYGLQDGTISITFASTSAGVSVLSTASQNFDLAHLEESTATIQYQLDDSVAGEIIFVATLDNGLHTWTQEFSKFYDDEVFEPIFVDDSSIENTWSTDTDWALTTEDFVSEPNSWTDSPNDDYDSNTETILTLEEPIDLTNAESAIVKFQAKWEIEANFDYAQFMVSSDGVNFEPQCGKYTVIGSDNQDENQPLYDDRQDDWVQEEIDLTAYLGQAVYFQFRMVSDGFVERDGFYFDDLTVEGVLDESTNVEIAPAAVDNIKVFPNPVKNNLQLDFILNQALQKVQIEVRNALGQVTDHQNFSTLSLGRHQWQFDTADWGKGVYFVHLLSDEGTLFSKKVLKF